MCPEVGRSGPFPAPLLSAAVTFDGHEQDELIDSEDDPFATGWWVGADDNWHPPDEPFSAGGASRPRGFRRVVIAILAVAIAAATTLSVLGGSGPFSSAAPSGPSLTELTSQVQQLVVGTGNDQLHLGDVSSVTCHPPGSWSSGQTFTCEVLGSTQTKIGEYVGTVAATTSNGEWHWRGTWRPTHPSTTS